ncbi:Fur family transcriptional regulator [Yersinia pestis]|uniref:Fur family transcriptional regulator n=1 Tax=Yersinia pseudotuberculosis TaxID=633 RepID=A0ABM7AQ59_YERPU|nr:Fur family transcriptional regulator [Yersinia pseudotuberculosis]AYW85545.1 Fur family transcriptional regulator [Yersinia pestis]QFR87300.1 Fur family transcriptional regulator [Yersinia pestis subsp. pestis bv. Medievalis]AYW89762.1 Fur family transcriptional regulator [Yersinia pseudotuberculosis]AYW94288.1 Fur family transcriptional regulator [Yersinia pseudotuberculosis]
MRPPKLCQRLNRFLVLSAEKAAKSACK